MINLLYIDANNVYGWAMSQLLPYKNTKLNNDITLETILNTADNDNIGYIVECDLTFPKHLHDKFKKFPSMPRKYNSKKRMVKSISKLFN